MHRAFARLLTTSVVLALGVAGMHFMPSHAFGATAAAPVLTVPGPQTVNEGALLAFTVSATDADGQPLFLRASGVPAGATFRDNFNNTGSFSWTPSYTQAGTYGVTFLADDTFGGVDAEGVSITVRNTNQPPLLDPIGDRFVERGTSMNIFMTGYDPDGDAVSFSQTGMPAFGSFTDYGDGSASLGLAPPANQPPGTTSMTVTLSDGTLTMSETFSITVYSVDTTNPPVLDPIGDQTVAEGATLNVTVSASDPDPDGLTFTFSLPGFASFTPTGGGAGSATGTLTLAPAACAAGTYAATIAVNDGALADNETFTITVTDVNRVPAWVPPSGYAMTLEEGSTASLGIQATDPDQACGGAGPTLSYVGGAPGALTVTLTNQGGGNGLLHVAAGFDASGTYTLTLRATDAAYPNTTTDVSVSVTVSGVNRAPVANAGGPYAGLVGQPVTMDGSGSSDPDGDALTYSWNFGDGGSESGAEVTHAYATFGTFVVSLTVSDGPLSATDTTTVKVGTAYVARAFVDHGTIRLKTGKPREPVYLEPVARSFELGAVDLSSIKLCAPEGSGTVSYIHPLADGFALGEDRDRNTVAEIRMEFGKEDLRSLLSNLLQESQMFLVLKANLHGGGSVQTTLELMVHPERKLVVRAHPNVMNPEAVIRVAMETPDRLTVRLYDITGRVVRTMVDGVDMPAGVHDFRFDGRNTNGQTLPSGRYFYRAETRTERSAGPLTIMK